VIDLVPTIALAIVVSLIVAEVNGGLVGIARDVVRAAARRVPRHRHRLQEEWLCEIEHRADRPLSALRFAARLYRDAGRIQIDLAPRPELPPAAQRAKRALDLLVAAILLGALAPIMLVFGGGIKLESPGPMFYRQTKRGRRGKPIEIARYRTLHHAGSEAGSPSQLGRLLRRRGLDLLPELYSVIRGDMTLVGPRPLHEHEAQLLDKALPNRPDLTPGLVDPLLLVEHQGSYHEVANLERRYIESWSLWQDIRILAATMLIALTQPRA
jgi:lipopolysaccharide/colanic/teichoic acid biosynthesis glycosyltransferase